MVVVTFTFAAVASVLLLLAAAASADEAANTNCMAHNIDFIMIDGDANLLAVEDDIRAQLAVVGINVTTRQLSKEDFNAAHQSGDFHLSFTETWGAPYDPHAYASGWIAQDEGHYQALSNLEAPVSRDLLFQSIEDVLAEEDVRSRESQWKEIHNTVHQQAVMLPLWGKRIPTVLNNRLVGYEAGLQQFEYPVHRLQVISGSTTATIAPGAQTGRFVTVGRLDPHSYRPNEFFANHCPQGQVLPALASTWSIDASGQTYTFTLRPNVTFHDGQEWNCAAAKLNLDHVPAEPLRDPGWHGWYGLPKFIQDWSCANDMELVVNLNAPYYPFLQELSFIRPLRFLSPAAFAGTDPVTANSCPTGWGDIQGETVTIACAGTTAVAGTGPFIFDSRVPGVDADGAEIDEQATFLGNADYWGGAPSIERLEVVHYKSSEDVKAAMLDGSLDMVWGSGVLQAKDLVDLEDAEPDLSVFHTGDVQNVLLLLNSGKAPLDSIELRKTVIHAIDKVAIIDAELGGVSRPVENVFPLEAPYCDVDLTPRWDYDLEKALFLNCPSQRIGRVASIIGIGLVAGCAILLMALFCTLQRNKQMEMELQELQKNSRATSA